MVINVVQIVGIFSGSVFKLPLGILLFYDGKTIHSWLSRIISLSFRQGPIFQFKTRREVQGFLLGAIKRCWW